MTPHRICARITALLFALVSVPTAHAETPLTPEDKRIVIDNAARLLTERYIDAKKGATLAKALPRAATRWRDVSDPADFAKQVTAWLRAQTGDGHLGLSYSEAPIAEASAGDFDAGEMERWYGPKVNHGVEKIERLEGNIMLLDLRVFPPPAMGAEVIAAAMTIVAQGDALIIDLRNNGGGAETVSLIAGYLLDGGEPMSGVYERSSDKLRATVAPHWVPGRRFGSQKPLYILTSKRTFSAAEALAYDLQALKRAVIVGERTGGGAHPFEYRRVHPHFALNLPALKSINPITGSNWQDVGVKPDIEVAPERALETALEVARQRVGEGK